MPHICDSLIAWVLLAAWLHCCWLHCCWLLASRRPRCSPTTHVAYVSLGLPFYHSHMCLQLAARDAWAGPRGLLSRSVLLLSYWPLDEHWNFLEIKGHAWRAVVVLVTAAQACRPPAMCEKGMRKYPKYLTRLFGYLAGYLSWASR
jgi:hypothetical protein